MEYTNAFYFFSCLVAADFFLGVNAQTQKATEMLWTAVEKNDLMGIVDAIHSRADLEWKNGSGFTALHLAAAHGHLETLSVLLMAGADKEAVTQAGDRPLQLAVANGSDATVALLAVAGANIKAAGSHDSTLLMEAVTSGKTTTAALLRAHLHANLQEVNGESVKASEMLWSAVENNDLMGIVDAIHSRADLEWKNGSGFTALHLAAARGHLEALSVLLMAGADKEAVTESGDRPLQLAAANGSDATVALLAVAGANIKATGSHDLTPLMEAVTSGKTTTAALLRALLHANDVETYSHGMASELMVSWCWRIYSLIPVLFWRIGYNGW